MVHLVLTFFFFRKNTRLVVSVRTHSVDSSTVRPRNTTEQQPHHHNLVTWWHHTPRLPHQGDPSHICLPAHWFLSDLRTALTLLIHHCRDPLRQVQTALDWVMPLGTLPYPCKFPQWHPGSQLLTLDFHFCGIAFSFQQSGSQGINLRVVSNQYQQI